LASSDSSGCCYVETKNLDGETSLKLKNINSNFKRIYPVEDKIYHEKIKISYPKPSTWIYQL
jgi:magnesium-transporting ATPase (P-type)